MRHEFFGSIKKHEVSRGEGSIKRHEVFGSIKRHEVSGGETNNGSVKAHEIESPSKDERIFYTRVSDHCSMAPTGGAGEKPLLGSGNTVQYQIRFG